MADAARPGTDRIRCLLLLVSAMLFYQGEGCGFGPASDFDKTRAGKSVTTAYAAYNMDDSNWQRDDVDDVNPVWTSVQYADDPSNSIKGGKWTRGSSNNDIWALPAAITHSLASYSYQDKVYFIENSNQPNDKTGTRYIATMRATQPRWNAVVLKFLYFCGYKTEYVDATPEHAELRVDLFFPGSGGRRTIWRVEDADKAMAADSAAIEAKASCSTLQTCTYIDMVTRSCQKCASVAHWKYATIRIPLTSEPYQIEITALDGRSGAVAFDLVSFESLEDCVPTWVPYYGVFNDVPSDMVTKGGFSLARCAQECQATATCDMFAYDVKRETCKYRTSLLKGTSDNPNDMCWAAAHSHFTTFELNCLTPAATYDVLMDSDGDIVQGTWIFDNCIESGTCQLTFGNAIGRRVKLGWYSVWYSIIAEGFGYIMRSATLQNILPYKRAQNVSLVDFLPPTYLDDFQPLGTLHTWCADYAINGDDQISLRLYKRDDNNAESIVVEAKSVCPELSPRRVGYEPLNFDSSAAALRVEEAMTAQDYPNNIANTNTNAGVTGQRLMIDVPVGLGCFSGYPTPADAQDFRNNDAPNCLVHCKGLSKPVAAVRGASCTCLDNMPYESLKPSRSCNVTCFSGHWMCGGAEQYNFYTASCPSGWRRVGHKCYKTLSNPAANTRGKAHALCTLENAELFAPQSSYAFNMVSRLLISDGGSAFLGYDRVLARGDTFIHYDGQITMYFAELKVLSGSAATCPVVKRTGSALTVEDNCAPAEIICQKRIVDGFGAQELNETDDLVIRAASSNTTSFSDPSQWWTPSADDQFPRLEWRFLRPVMVSGFKISSKASHLLKGFKLKYKEDHLTGFPERVYAPTSSDPAHEHEFRVTHGMTMEDEFTVYIHMAYPKVSNWFAIVPTELDSDAEVKVTLLGSASVSDFAVRDFGADERSRAENLCRTASHTQLENDGFTLLNTEPTYWAIHNSLIHVYEKDATHAFQFCQIRTQCFRNGDSNVQCSPYRALWQTRQGGRNCPTGFNNTMDICNRQPELMASSGEGRDLCLEEFSHPLGFRTVVDLVLYAAMLAATGVTDSVYIDVRRDGDHFVDGYGSPLAAQFVEMWADGEPSDVGDCVVLDAESGFNAKVVDCNETHLTVCQSIDPRFLPADFEYLGDSFNGFHFNPDTARSWDHLAAAEYCRSRGTSLAVPADQGQLDFIMDVMERASLAMHGSASAVDSGALGAVRLLSDADTTVLSHSINNIRPRLKADDWNLFSYFDATGYRPCTYATDDSVFGAECVGDYLRKNYPICQYHACYSEGDSQECVFPFLYKGRKYAHCTTVDSADDTAWCPTRLENGVASRRPGTFATCMASCPVTQCPVGFFEMIGASSTDEPLCMLLSSYQDELAKSPASTPAVQRDFCSDLGARQISLEHTYHMSKIKRAVKVAFPELESKPFAVDGIYRKNALQPLRTSSDMSAPLYVRQYIDTIIANSASTAQLNTTCLVMMVEASQKILQSVPCDSGQAYHACVADLEYTESGPAAGQLCHFPFLHDGNWHTSCAMTANRTEPWCATSVLPDGQVDGDNWGFCRRYDELTVAGKVTLARCQLPFIANGILYENCTWAAKDLTGVANDGKIWCSTRNDADGVMASPDDWGACHENMWPPGLFLCRPPFYGVNQFDCQYVHHEIAVNSTDAEALCTSLDAALIFPMTADLQAKHEVFLSQKKNNTYFPDFDYVHTSAIKVGDTWMWSEASVEFDFTNWAEGVNPEDDGCVFLDANSEPPFKWVIKSCDTPAYAACRVLCPDGYLFSKGSCLSVNPDEQVALSNAEALCALRGERLLTPDSEAHLAELQGQLAEQWPDADEFHIGLVACRLTFQAAWHNASHMGSPRTTYGELVPWMKEGQNFDYELPFTCTSSSLTGLFFTLQPHDTVPLMARVQSRSPYPYICSGTPSADACPDGFISYDDQCYKVSQTATSYHEAQNACHQQDSDLMRPIYLNQIHFLRHLIRELNTADLTRDNVWLGFDRIDNPLYTDIFGIVGAIQTDMFLDGAGAAGDDCAVMSNTEKNPGNSKSLYYWQHYNCDQPAHYICHYKGQEWLGGSSPCPDDFPMHYQGQCLRVSNESRTFAQAEVECARMTEGLSKLVAPLATNVSLLRYLAVSLNNTWVGLDDRLQQGLTNSDGDLVDAATVARLPTSGASAAGAALCMAIVDGSYVYTDCQEKRPYVCQLLKEPICPAGFIRHHKRCFWVPEYRKNYSTAERTCAYNGSFVASDRDVRQAAFLQELMISVGHDSYWIGLSSDEPEDTALSYPDWSAFNAAEHSRFGAAPSSAAPACTTASEADQFAAWHEAACDEKHYHLCQYNGLPSCPDDYTPFLDSGYSCIRVDSGTGSYWQTSDTCYSDGPNTGLVAVTSPRVKAGLMDYLRSQNTLTPVWIRFRGPVVAVDQPHKHDKPPGVLIQWFRWVNYHDTTITAEVAAMGSNATDLDIWREKCATLDANGQWLRNDCNAQFTTVCENTACYTERGHQCVFPFIGAEDGVEYHNCTSLDEADIFQPWCATEVNNTGHATRVEKCLPYCYFKKPVIKCYDLPPRPPAENETAPDVQWRAMWESSWDGSNAPKKGEKVTYLCPIGYVFDSNNKRREVATCGNWTWEASPALNTTTCQPVQCPEKLPNVIDVPAAAANATSHSAPPEAAVTGWNGLHEYLTEINFTCPTGHVFEGVSRRPEEEDWAVNPSDLSQLFSAECDASGEWSPHQLPSCVPYDCLGPPPAEPPSVSSDWDNLTISYNHSVRYWCTPGVGWGFPSDGAVERRAVCLENGSWSLEEVEDCILMPCEDPAPPTVGNQTFVYGLVTSTYTCPPAWEFPNGTQDMTVECLLETKVWEPAVVPPCRRRRCEEAPPEKAPDKMRRVWPVRQDGTPNTDLDVVIEYICSRWWVTWDFNETKQEVTCVHEPESDTMIWDPVDIVECNRSVPLPPYDGITLPPPPPVDVTYPATTDYYWGTIEQNTTAVPAGGGFVTGDGPFGFKSSVILPGDSCMLQESFMRPGDTCVNDPATCVHGLSFSLWHKSVFDSDLFTPREELPHRYLLSTGGDVEGSPGIAIYLQGMTLSVLVSTGSRYWLVETIGLLANNTWNNIGIRWRAPSEGEESVEFVGLQLYLNQKPAGLTVHGVTPSAIAKKPLDPPEFMVGCHKASGETEYRHFCPCEFDEIAMWKRALLTNESMFFIGGFEEDFAGVTAEEFAEMLMEVDLTDPDQQSVAVSIASKIVDGPEERPATDDGNDEGSQEEDEDESADADTVSSLIASSKQISKMNVLANMMFSMTSPEVVKPNQTAAELDSFMNLVNLASQLLESKHETKWIGIEQKNDKEKPDPRNPEKEIVYDGEAADMIDRMESFAMASVASLVHDDVNGSVPDLFVRKRTANVQMYVQQRDVGALRRNQLTLFPSDRPRKLDSIEVPTVVFRKSGCEKARVSTVFTKYDNYAAVSPRRFLRNEFKTLQNQYLDIDGDVLSLRVAVMVDGEETEECLPTIDDLRQSPVRTSHRHHQPKLTLREPLFHENEVQSDVLRRHCVWWDAERMDGRGAWDATACVVLETNEFFTKCACKTFGQYAVVAEKVEPKIVEIDSEWLALVKNLFHAVSMILLLVYALIVWKNAQLWEMFHQMRMATAILLFFGCFFMLQSDRASVRADRHSCTTVAAFLQLVYLAAGAMVACEGYACFRALTYGVVGGKLRSYFAISFGVSLLSLGYALGTDIHSYGDDPQCMMGWETHVKLIFFSPMMFCLLLSFVSAFLIMCNMSVPHLRKQSMAHDHESVCYGYIYFTLYFVMTWVAGLLAYVRFDNLKSMPTFYPLFQFLNAACGLVFFVCQGLLSRRFVSMLLGRGHERRRLLLAYATHDDEPEPVDRSEPPAAGGDTSDEDDSEADPEAARAATKRGQQTEGPQKLTSDGEDKDDPVESVRNLYNEVPQESDAPSGQ